STSRSARCAPPWPTRPRCWSPTAARLSASSRAPTCSTTSRSDGRRLLKEITDMTTQHDRFDTLAIHAGQHPDPTTGDAIPAIHVTSTYAQDGIGGLRGGYEYSRGGNPTRTALEEQLAAIEGGAAGISFASGLAAEDALLRAVVSPGDHVLVPNDVYGGTHRLVRTVHGKAGVAHSTVDTADPDAVRAAVRPESKVLWVETPSNPLMKISDIPALAQLAHEHGLLLVVDNTFASPALQRPLDLGADV